MSPASKDGPVGEWLSLGPASRMLGVDPDTLRRWADTGRVEAFATPGGHRRFDRRSLERLIAANRAGRLPLTRLGGTTERFAAAYRRRYQVRRREAGGAGEARRQLRPADQDAFREDGRRLVAALVRRLDLPSAAERTRADAEAAEVAASMGRRTGGTDVTLGVATAMFVAARQPFLTELGAIGRRRALSPGQLSSLYDEASAVLDQLLLAFLDGYQTQHEAHP